MDFSDRMGFTEVRKVVQLSSMDPALRNSLFNVLYGRFGDDMYSQRWSTSASARLYRRVWAFRRKLPIDECPEEGYKAIAELKEFVLKEPWHQVYNLLEFIAQDPYGGIGTDFQTNINAVLEMEMSGYRFVGDIVSPITSETEIQEVETALAATDQFKPVASHLKVALELLANREAPDYRNSIKESISAVEAACQIVTGDHKATLGSAVKKLEDAGVTLHAAFKTALEKMYGYTSDAQGIRHALLDESTLEQADALFMLVACSAFVNYLKAKLAVHNKSR